MFEKLKQLYDQGKSMLQEAFIEPEEDTFIAVPEGVTEEQLIEEARQYVDAIIVVRHKKDSNDSPAEDEKQNEQEE